MTITKKDLETIRALIREEITNALQAKTAALAYRPTPPEPGVSQLPRPQRHALEIDNIVDELENEGYQRVAVDYQKRRDVGMSKALAEVKAKIANGYDLTPIDYELPRPASYFLNAAFQASYVARIESGEEINPAYESACAEFGLPAGNKRAGRYAGVLAELPETPRGGFTLGRGAAAEQVGTQRQLGMFDGLDDD